MGAEERVDELFRLPPEEFTRARDALAKELRAAGDSDSAASVKKLRRPTVAAWAVNQLARQQRTGLQQLREAGEELARQQRRAMSGLDRSGLRAAQEQRRRLTALLAAHALGVLRDAGVAAEQHADAVRQALDAAALDAQAGEAVLQGRLSRPPQPPAGFGAVAALSAIPSDGGDAGGDTDGPGARLARAHERLDVARAAAQERRAEADDATRAAERAADESRRLERELARAREREAAAAERAKATAARAEAAEATLARRQHDLAQVEADVAAEQ